MLWGKNQQCGNVWYCFKCSNKVVIGHNSIHRTEIIMLEEENREKSLEVY